MAYKPELEPDENLALQIAFKVSEKSPVFNFAVSNRALYWPATKTFAVNDATYFKRIRNGEITEVRMRRLPPYGLWAVAILMVQFGSVVTYFMLAPSLNHDPGLHHESGWPFGIIAGGILMPFAARGRLGLEVRTHDKTFRWKPPLVIGKAAKQKIESAIEEMITACEKSGLRVSRN
jgi:hypothetical protein